MKKSTIYILSVIIPGVVFAGTSHQSKVRQVVPPASHSPAGILTGEILDSIQYDTRVVAADSAPDAPIQRHTAEGVAVVDGQPVPIRMVPPKYPLSARRSKIGGTIWIKCLISPEGNVSKAEVLRADRKADALGKSAIEAVLQWKFSPATLRGIPVAVWASIPFRFSAGK